MIEEDDLKERSFLETRPSQYRSKEGSLRLRDAIGLFPVYLYIVAGSALFLSVADNHFGRVKVLPIPPTVAALVFLAPLSGFLILKDLLTRPALNRTIGLIVQNRLVVLPFLLVVFLALLFAMHPTAYWEENAKYILLEPYDFCIFLFAMILPLLRFVRENFVLLSLVGLLVLLLSIAQDVMTPGTFSTEATRAAGFAGNSNWSALAVVMLCAATLRYRVDRFRLFDVTVIVITGLGVFATLSRSGALNYALLVVIYTCLTFFTRSGGMKTGVMLVFTALAVGVAFFILVPVLFSDSVLFAQSKAQNRLFALLEGKVEDDGSSAGRLDAATHAMRLIEESPIIGHGTGFTRTVGVPPHNLYLNQWVNNGLAGLIAYLALLLGALLMFVQRRYSPGIAFVITVIVGSLFSHNVLEQRSFLILLGSLSTISLFYSRKCSRRAV